MRRIIMALMLASLVAFAVGGAAWVLVAPPPAKAAFPGHNGRIVFNKYDSDGFAQIWVANKDLSNQHKLTSGKSNSGGRSGNRRVPNSPSIPIAPIPMPRAGPTTSPGSTTSSR